MDRPHTTIGSRNVATQLKTVSQPDQTRPDQTSQRTSTRHCRFSTKPSVDGRSKRSKTTNFAFGVVPEA